MTTVEWSNAAREDLDDLEAFISRNSRWMRFGLQKKL
jgi:plasmid stabilization system protein ParE